MLFLYKFKATAWNLYSKQVKYNISYSKNDFENTNWQINPLKLPTNIFNLFDGLSKYSLPSILLY